MLPAPSLIRLLKPAVDCSSEVPDMKQSRREAASAGPVDKGLIERWALAYLNRFRARPRICAGFCRAGSAPDGPEKPGAVEMVDYRRHRGIITAKQG